MLAVAAAYFATGRLGLDLAIPPGYATAVWPPSGIALAAVLLGGARMWPGILLGSFLINVATGFDAGTPGALALSLIVPAIIASGSTVQAVGGAWLVRRFGRFPNPLRTVPQIACLLLLGGAGGCVISASIGVATLTIAGRIPLAGIPFTWLTWWGGDTIGVFIFTPLILAWFMRPRAEWRGRAIVITTATTAAFALVVGLAAYTSHLDRRNFAAQLTERGEDLRVSLANMVTSRLQVVHALDAFLTHDEAITPGEFNLYSTALRAHMPGVFALEWVPRVPSDQRRSFETWARHQGLANFEITEKGDAGLVPVGARADYFPVTYLEPAGGRERAVGYDLASDSERRAALVRARNSGEMSVTGTLPLVESKEKAVLAVAPVYRGNADDLLEQRQDRFAGFAVGVLRLADLSAAAFEGRDISDIHYWLVDETVAPVVLAANTTDPPAAFAMDERGLFGGNVRLSFSHRLDIGGRRWIFRVAPTQVFIAKHREQNAGFVLIGGLVAASIIAAFAMVVTGREGELRRLVDDRTQTLQAALGELGRSEGRYRALFLGSRVPMLLIDPFDGAIVDANRAAGEYYGFGIAGLKTFNIGDINILPRAALMAQLERARTEGLNHFHFRHRLASGEIRDVEVHSAPIEMDGRTVLYSIIHDITERSRLEAERRRLVMAVEQSPVSIIITDAVGVIEYVNAAFTRITGYAFDEVMGQNPNILKSGATSDEEYRAMWADLVAGKAWRGEFHNKRKDGSLYWEQAQISPVFDTAGRITNYLAIKENITARKEAEEAIAGLNRQLRDVLAAASEVAIIATGPDGIITLFNRGAENMLGYQESAVVGQHSPLLFHAIDEMEAHGKELSAELGHPVEGFRVFVEKAERDGHDLREWTWGHKDGRLLTVSLAVTPVRSVEGSITGYLGVAQDITERKTAEAALRASEARYRATFEQAAIGFIQTTFEGRLLAFNSRFCDIIGYPPDEASALNWEDITYPEDRPHSSREIARMLARETKTAIWEKRYVRKDGRLVWVRLTCTIQHDEFGHPLHFITAVEDIDQRKAAEGELRAVTARLKLVLDTAAEGIVGIDNENRIVLANHAAVEALGRSSVDALLGKLSNIALGHIHADGSICSEASCSIRHTLVDGQTRRVADEYFIKGGSGTAFPVEYVVSALVVEGGNAGAVIAFHDISERKWAEMRLAREAARYQFLLKTASDGIHVLDESGNLIEASDSFRTMLGYAPEQAASLNVRDWDAMVTPDEFRDMLARLISAPQIFETRHRRADGSVVDVEINCHGVEFEGKTYLYASSRDITERKRLEEALRQSEQRFRLLFNSGNDSVWLHAIDPDTGAPLGHFIEINEVACRRLGYTHDELLQMGPADIDDPSTPTVDDRVANLIKNDWAVFERLHVAKSGRRIPVEISARKLVHQGQTLLLAICRDITQRYALEEELRRSNAELEQFAYVASHDLRQPLRMVTSYLSLIERNLAERLDEDTRQYMDYARDGAKKMDHLILDLLEYSRIGRHGAPVEPVALAEVVEEAMLNLGVAIADAKAVVTVQPDLPIVFGCRSELTRLLQNLLGNAVKYRAADRIPEITLGCRRQGATWLISIRDNGIGIPADQAERVFGVFQRLHTSQQYEGTGIGLAVCRKIVEHHGGRIWVETAVTPGSEFRFTLPVEVAPCRPDAVEEEGRSTGHDAT